MFSDVIYKTKMNKESSFPKNYIIWIPLLVLSKATTTSLKIYCTCTFGKLKFFEISLHGVIIFLLFFTTPATATATATATNNVVVIKKTHYTFTALENFHILHISSFSSTFLQPMFTFVLTLHTHTCVIFIHSFIHIIHSIPLRKFPSHILEIV